MKTPELGCAHTGNQQEDTNSRLKGSPDRKRDQSAKSHQIGQSRVNKTFTNEGKNLKPSVDGQATG